MITGSRSFKRDLKTFKSILEGKETFGYETTYISKFGETVHLVFNVRFIKNADGEVIGTQGTAHNITEHKKLEKSLLEIEERERQRIGRDLHDDLGQLLTGVSFKSQYLETTLKEKSIPEAEDVARIRFLIDKAKEKTKLLSKGLLFSGDTKEGLVSSLQDLAHNVKEIYNISCDFKSDETVPIYSESAVTNLYRIAQEAVINAVKHGKPNHIGINLFRNNDKIEMKIEDDGKGIPYISEQTYGMGLSIMNYRSNIIGASLNIHSEINEGTQVVCIFDDKISLKE